MKQHDGVFGDPVSLSVQWVVSSSELSNKSNAIS